MSDFYFDDQERFVIEHYARRSPFASFLPGIAGLNGIPMWVFYVNRGQAVAGFGIADKDNPIMEFQPANKAYQSVGATGFRTFIKFSRQDGISHYYEPFIPGDPARMAVGMNDLQLAAENARHGLRVEVTYFTLNDEPLAGLVRRLTLTNTGPDSVALELLDGLAQVQPFGVDNNGLKQIGRTLEAWMGVYNVEQNVPFYRFQASAGDSAEVTAVQAGHFYFAFVETTAETRLLPAFVDPDVVFGPDTSLSAPDGFINMPLADLQKERQITCGKTPCGFFGAAAALAPGQTLTLYAVVGHAGSLEQINRRLPQLARADYLQNRHAAAVALARELTDPIAATTADPRFDRYSRQTFLDNILRGGWPILLGPETAPTVYHVYSRKHGDLERDYNAFYIAPEPYSQGNGNYRDVNQNRRSDLLFNPRVGDFNLIAFLSLIQIDGYNPLVIEGCRFTLAPEERAALLALVERPEPLAARLDKPFTPGQLLRTIADHDLGLKVSAETFIAAALAHAQSYFSAALGEGFWIDHWTYNLDLLDSYLAVYPDRKAELLFETAIPCYESAARVLPRDRRYVLAGDKVRQYGGLLHEDKEKAALIAARAEDPYQLRTGNGRGEIYRGSVAARLLGLALLKFAALDPAGMGIAMEAGKPGWYDALNGLPGLFGSSLCESYELARLFDFLHAALTETPVAVALPVEQANLWRAVAAAQNSWENSTEPDRDFQCWDAVTTSLELYRERIRLGIDGAVVELPAAELLPTLAAFRARLQTGFERAAALSTVPGLPPTYFTFTVTGYQILVDSTGQPQCDSRGRPYIRALAFAPRALPPFLEGPVHAMKLAPDAARARDLYAAVKAGPLFDAALGMYKVNASLDQESHELGRCRAFTPGWLENESIWLHMEYKYLLETLRAGLYEEFFADFQSALIPFQAPKRYGRSPLENSSFIVSSAHPDPKLHGRGFVARLSGATAEFLSLWTTMMAGQQPFSMVDGELHLTLQPALPGRLFPENGELAFRFLNQCTVVYHNPERLDTWTPDLQPEQISLRDRRGTVIELAGGVIGAPYAAQIRAGEITQIDIHLRRCS